ncbi:VENN motif pre-toxin domain-containing protein [Rahnella bruchi]
MAEYIKTHTAEGAERIISHALAGAIVAEMQGGNAAAGAAGAGLSAAGAKYIAAAFYPGRDIKDLSEEEKQGVVALATLASGIAGGVVGGDVSSGIDGAKGGKNEVENNALSDIAQAQSEGKTLEQKAAEFVEAENERYKKENCGGLSAETCSAKMYDERREALKGTTSFGADFVPVVGDIKGFAEADSAIGYLAAVIGLIPGLGDVAGKSLKAAEKALAKGDLESASKLINQASNEIQSVKALDVGSYKDLKAREVVGDGLEHDHIPSFAALRKAKETELGRKLSPAEEKALYQNATAVEVPKDVHTAGPTYGGKNNATQVQNDAMDLCGAVCRDTDSLRKNMLERGYDPKLVDDAIKQIQDRNQQMGVIK